MSDNATCSNCGRDENLFDNSYGEHFCVDVPECAAVCAEQRDTAKAEAQQWQNELAIYKSTENERIKHLELWKESVLAVNLDRGPCRFGNAAPHNYGCMNHDDKNGLYVLYEDYRLGTEHLAAKLVEAQSAFRTITEMTDLEMRDGDAARKIAADVLAGYPVPNHIANAGKMVDDSFYVDANRYRYIRAACFGGEHDPFLILNNDPETGDSQIVGGDELDTVVDAAMNPRATCEWCGCDIETGTLCSECPPAPKSGGTV